MTLDTALLLPTRPAKRPADERATLCPDAHFEQCLDLLDDIRQGHTQKVRLGKLLGQGGMGAVFDGIQATLGRPVAVKMPYQDADQAAIAGMVAEALITGHLEHPGIVPVHTLHVNPEGIPYLILKRVTGRSWQALMREQSPETRSTAQLIEHLQIWRQVCLAVEFAHAQGVLHRDIKPENVMVGDFGEVYLLDWGIAVTLDDAADQRLPRLDVRSAQAGTPNFMSPEQAHAMVEQTTATDVFLLGATLYELLAGHPPFEGPNVLAVLMHAAMSQPPPLPDHVDPRLAALCQRAMAPEPAHRTESAKVLAQRVDTWIHQHAAYRLMASVERRVLKLEVIARSANHAGTRLRLEADFDIIWGTLAQVEAQIPADTELAELKARAAVAMAFIALHFNDHDTARLRLAQAGERAPAEARQTLAAAIAQADQARARREAEAARRDPTRERRLRAWAVLTLGLLWVGTPASAALLGRMPPLSQLRDGNLFAGFVALLVIGIWRRRLWTTAPNRTVLVAMLGGSFGLAALDALGHATGVAPPTVYTQHLVLATVLLGMVSVGTDHRMWPSILGYALATAGSALYPDAVMSLTALANLSVCLNVAVLWLRVEPTPT